MELLPQIENSADLATDWSKTENLPAVIQLWFTKCGERYTEVITNVRKNLSSVVFIKNTQTQQIGSEERNQFVDILDQLKFFIQTKDAVAVAWIKVIKGDVDPENEVIDLFIILILHSIPRWDSAGDVLLRNQLKCGLFGEISLRTIFETYQWALKEYFDVIVTVANKFHKHDKEIFSKFGSNLYKNLCDYLDLRMNEAVIEKLLHHFGSYKSSEIDCAIELLTALIEINPEQIAHFAVYTERIIDYFDRYSIHQIRSVYSCLSVLACKGDGNEELLQDNLMSIIHKQVTNSDLQCKRIGIVGSIAFVKNLASESEQPHYNDQNYNKRCARAMFLSEFLFSAIQNNNSALAFYFEEIYSFLLRCDIYPTIQDWIKKSVKKNFSHNYILRIEHCASELLQFSLHPTEDCIALNFYPLIECEEKNKGTSRSKKASLINLIPQFKIIHFCESSYDHLDLEAIEGLLACPVLLFPMEKLDNFAILDEVEKNLICSALFHTINWFRVLVNSFSYIRTWETRDNVVFRLKNITHLETVLKKCLANNLGFRPPVVYFEGDENVELLKRKQERSDTLINRKRRNNDSTSEECRVFPVPSTSNLTDTKKSKENEVSVVELSQYEQYFIQLDLCVFQLLEEKLNLPDLITVSQDGKRFLTPLELIFLLEDFKQKLEFLLRPAQENLNFGHKKSSKESSRFSNISGIKLTYCVMRIVGYIPHLRGHLESAIKYFQILNADSAESRTESPILVASCLKLILDSLSIIFSWEEFNQHQELKLTAINHLAKQLSSSGKSELNIEDGVNAAFDCVMKLSESLPNFSCAVAILSLGEKILAFNKTDINLIRLSEVAEEFLKRPWFDKFGKLDQGTKHNQELQNVLTLLVEFNSNPLKLLETLTTIALPELAETQVESKTYRTMTRSSFSVYYRIMFASLGKEAKKITNDNLEDVSGAFIRWSLAVKTFHILVNVIKIFKDQKNFVTCVKNSRTFLETFLMLGMSLMDSALNNHKDDVLELFRFLLLDAHFLQNICCHPKMINQIAIVEYIQRLKNSLNALIYQVEAILSSHNCQNVCMFENLKFNDQGEEEIAIDSDEEVDELQTDAEVEEDNED